MIVKTMGSTEIHQVSGSMLHIIRDGEVLLSSIGDCNNKHIDCLVNEMENEMNILSDNIVEDYLLGNISDNMFNEEMDRVGRMFSAITEMGK